MNQYQLLRQNSIGEYIGINLNSIKAWITSVTPYHAHLEHFEFVHYRAKAQYLRTLEQEVSWSDLLHWPEELKNALNYIAILINELLIQDETTYRCNLQTHGPGEPCPNRANLSISDPEILERRNQ